MKPPSCTPATNPPHAGAPALSVLRPLLQLFDEEHLLPQFHAVAPADMPAPYHALLVHAHHMTVTLDAHFGERVAVRVVQTRQTDTTYTRRSLLLLPSSGRIVQHCTVHIALDQCSDAVAREVVAGTTPLGYILIRHNVMRRIEPRVYLKIDGANPIMQAFEHDGTPDAYGRVATIHCDGKPAIELLEIVAPERETAP